MAGWHHWLDGHESEWTPGVGDRQGGLACCDSWGRKESDMTERLNWLNCGCFWAFLVAQMVKNPPVMWETWILFLGWEDPQGRAWKPTLVFLLGQFHEQRSLAVYSPWGRKELDMTEWLRNSSIGAFMLEWKNWIVVTKTIWPMKSKISLFTTIWPFRKFADSCFRGMPLFSIYQIRTFCLCVWFSHEGNAKNASYSSLLRGSI